MIGTRAAQSLLGLAAERGVPARGIGRATGSRLVIGPPGTAAWIDVEVAALQECWRAAIPRRLEVA